MADFSKKQIQEIWEKGTNSSDPNWKKDIAGAWMHFDFYGKKTDYGWTIDHIYPEAKGGKDNIENLQPMQWENNLSKTDDYPTFNTKISSDGNKNIEKPQTFSYKKP